MKMVLHRGEDRGAASLGWLETRYSFSFADWHRADRMGFGALRVLNDDRIAPLSGFPLHGHRDMEIVTIVTKGELTHSDSLGSDSRIMAGEVQAMSAGTGIIHSEHNSSAEEALELFQIWIRPEVQNAAPLYAQKRFDLAPLGLALLIAPDGAQGSLSVRQEAWISHLRLSAGQSCPAPAIGPKQGLYAFIVSGVCEIAGVRLGARDALGLYEAPSSDLLAVQDMAALLIAVPIV